MSDDLTPAPAAWPECSECGVAYVLRHCITFTDGYRWLWQRDCGHEKAEPRISEAT